VAPQLVTVDAYGTLTDTEGKRREIRVGRAVAEGSQQKRLRT
jgi:FMN phosphatase YigB (HAD superfamily)